MQHHAPGTAQSRSNQFSNRHFRVPPCAGGQAVELLGLVPITEHEARIAIVRVDDDGAARRDDWLSQWIVPVTTDPFTQFASRALVRQSAAFDMVVIHADEPATMAAFTRDFTQRVPGKLLIACLTAPSPSASAHILRAGADAVIDLAMGRDVAAAYVRSLARRSRMNCAV